MMRISTLLVAISALQTICQPNFVIHGAEFVEGCPSDSVLLEDRCECQEELCTKPPCLSELILVTNGTNIPGMCCPIYECTNCSEDALINSKCPCAVGAVLNMNKCECVDEEKELVGDQCQCNPVLCELPQICPNGSIAVNKQTDGCCTKTKCIPCPRDSFSPNRGGNIIEEPCVCFPCKDSECPANQKVQIRRYGNNMPGTCCNLYDCIPMDNDRICKSNTTWTTPDKKQCKCDKGVALCTQASEKQRCLFGTKAYEHKESWNEDKCTNCTCDDGHVTCISHFCDIIEGRVTTSGECPELVNCKKLCPNGFKQKRGCEICKCISGTTATQKLNGTLPIGELHPTTVAFETTTVYPAKVSEPNDWIIWVIGVGIIIIIVILSTYCYNNCRKKKQKYKTVNNNNKDLPRSERYSDCPR